MPGPGSMQPNQPTSGRSFRFRAIFEEHTVTCILSPVILQSEYEWYLLGWHSHDPNICSAYVCKMYHLIYIKHTYPYLVHSCSVDPCFLMVQNYSIYHYKKFKKMVLDASRIFLLDKYSPPRIIFLKTRQSDIHTTNYMILFI